MKTLKASKCKNGWIIEITDRVQVSCESDVLKVIRENGLKIKKQFSHKPDKENKNEWILAE